MLIRTPSGSTSRAIQQGLVNKICSGEGLAQEAMDKAREIAENRADAVVGIRKFNQAVEVSVMGERLVQVKKSNR